MTDHPDFETLSAALDGDPEPSHVQGCAICRGRLAELRLARDAVAQPVAPPAPDVREQAIARALAAAGHPAPVRALRPRRSWWLGGSAAAAVVAVVVGAVALVGGLGGSTDNDTATSSFDSSAERAAGPTPTESIVDGGDLGDVASVDALRQKVVPSRAAAPAAPAAGNALGATADAAAALPRQVGTRVCEIEARTAHPQLGYVVYAANLRFDGTAAVVLGFAATATGPPETLLVLAPQQGCRILAETPS